MGCAIVQRDDYSSRDLLRLGRCCSDGDQVRRRLALAVILDGGSRSDAAKVGGVTLQVIRDWVLRFNAEGIDGLITRKASGKAGNAPLCAQGPADAISLYLWRDLSRTGQGCRPCAATLQQ